MTSVMARTVASRRGTCRESRCAAPISASGGHHPIEGRDERERCARKRSEHVVAPGTSVAEPNCGRVRSTRRSNGGQRDRGTDPTSQGHARHPTDAGGVRPLLSAETHAALKPRRPVPEGRLRIVATGEKEDNVAKPRGRSRHCPTNPWSVSGITVAVAIPSYLPRYG